MFNIEQWADEIEMMEEKLKWYEGFNRLLQDSDNEDRMSKVQTGFDPSRD